MKKIDFSIEIASFWSLYWYTSVDILAISVENWTGSLFYISRGRAGIQFDILFTRELIHYLKDRWENL